MRKTINRIGKIIIYLISIIVILIFSSFLVFIPLVNNFILYKQEKRLSDIKLPYNTQLIEKQSVCGKLCGNGNGIDYLATILINSNLSIEELKEYYSDYEVAVQNSSELENDYLEHNSITYRKLKNVTEFKNYYVVYSYKSAKFGSIWEWDIRGH